MSALCLARARPPTSHHPSFSLLVAGATCLPRGYLRFAPLGCLLVSRLRTLRSLLSRLFVSWSFSLFIPHPFRSAVSRSLRRTCIGAGRSEHAHLMPLFHQRPRHILRHSSGRNLRATKKTINDENFHNGLQPGKKWLTPKSKGCALREHKNVQAFEPWRSHFHTFQLSYLPTSAIRHPLSQPSRRLDDPLPEALPRKLPGPLLCRFTHIAEYLRSPRGFRDEGG